MINVTNRVQADILISYKSKFYVFCRPSGVNRWQIASYHSVHQSFFARLVLIKVKIKYSGPGTRTVALYVGVVST
jgi:hypothetical protein